jgi:hypothetical protein
MFLLLPGKRFSFGSSERVVLLVPFSMHERRSGFSGNDLRHFSVLSSRGNQRDPGAGTTGKKGGERWKPRDPLETALEPPVSSKYNKYN